MKPHLLTLAAILTAFPLYATPSEDAAAQEKELMMLRARKRVEQLMEQDKLANAGAIRAAEEKKREAEARQAAILAARQNRIDKAGPLTPAKKAVEGVVVDKSGVRKIEDAAEHVYFSWQARYTNATAKPVKIYPEVRLLDKNGYVIETSAESSTLLAPGASQVISGKSITKRALWAQYATAEFRSQ